MRPKTKISNEKGTKISSKLSKIVGAVKLPKKFNAEKELSAYYENKHTKLYI